MPRRVPQWFNRHPNLFAFGLVVIVFIWAIVQIGDEAEKRAAAEKKADAKLELRISQESKARQEIICLVANDGVDRDKAFIDAFINSIIDASRTSARDESPQERAEREKATRDFLSNLFKRLEPSLRTLECQKFIQDPIRYLQELRQRTDIAPTTTTTIAS